MGVKFDNYAYYVNESNQRVTGDVTIVFTGSVVDNAFIATKFTIFSDGALTLSDAADQIGDMSLTIPSGTTGKIGTSDTGNGIKFQIANTKDSVNILIYYYDDGDKYAEGLGDVIKAKYDAAKHSFVVDLFN